MADTEGTEPASESDKVDITPGELDKLIERAGISKTAANKLRATLERETATGHGPAHPNTTPLTML